MIARFGTGYTTLDNADAYEALLKTEIFPGIVARNIAGSRRIELLRGPVGEGRVCNRDVPDSLTGGKLCRRGLCGAAKGARRPQTF